MLSGIAVLDRDFQATTLLSMLPSVLDLQPLRRQEN